MSFGIFASQRKISEIFEIVTETIEEGISKISEIFIFFGMIEEFLNIQFRLKNRFVRCIAVKSLSFYKTILTILNIQG